VLRGPTTGLRPSQERIQRRPILGDLINEHELAAYNRSSAQATEFWNPFEVAFISHLWEI